MIVLARGQSFENPARAEQPVEISFAPAHAVIEVGEGKASHRSKPDVISLRESIDDPSQAATSAGSRKRRWLGR